MDKNKLCGSHLSLQEDGKYSKIKNFSKIPKLKTKQSTKSLELPVKNALACLDEKENSFFQLYITKVYFIQDLMKKEGLPEDRLDENVVDLANKITALCHKIKDVESCMFIGPHGVNPQIELGPQGTHSPIKCV